MLRVYLTMYDLMKRLKLFYKKYMWKRKLKLQYQNFNIKELLLLCTKHLHFRFNDEIYTQIDGLAMGSSLVPLLANIFMMSLEEKVLPKVSNYLRYWKHYVDDTFAYVVPEKINFILKELNSYHPNLKFTYELEENNKITFLEVLLNRITTSELASMK